MATTTSMVLTNYRQTDTRPHHQPQTESAEEVLAAHRIVSQHWNTRVMNSNLLVNIIHEYPSRKYISTHSDVYRAL